MVEATETGFSPAATPSPSPAALTFAEILSALSFAIDLTEGAVPGHALRSCILGMRLARELGMPKHRMSSLYYALLVKDAGCSSNAARMCQIVGGDDRMIKNGAKLQDWTKPHKPALSTIRLLWREVLPRASWLRRLGRIARIAATQHRNNREVIQLRCERGAEIARKLGLSEEAATAVRGLDEHWDGSGYPDRKRGRTIPLLARIVAVAQHLDIFACEHDPRTALRVLQLRSGTWFDPALVALALRLAEENRLWMGCLPDDDPGIVRQLTIIMQPDNADGISSDGIDRICEAFADVVDAKSPFTYRHSIGVADVASRIAKELDLPEDRRRLVWRAALLHDLGKLAIPNTILDKPDRLTAEEFAGVAEHPRLSREILARIKPFAEIAEIAGAHHERLDGSGYPGQLTGDQLSLEARLVAVADFYRALVEDRPYRAGIPHEAAMRILREQPLDPACVEALDRSHMPETQPSTHARPRRRHEELATFETVTI